METKKEDITKFDILKAASNSFQRLGVNKTTMEDIAREAGKGKSTLYYYYKSKDEIFETLAMHELNNMIIKTRTSVCEVCSSKEKLKKYILTMLNEIKKTVSIYPLVKGEIKGNKEFIDKIRKQINDKEESIILEILEQGFVTGEFLFFSATELSKVANVIVCVVRGLELQLLYGNDDNEKVNIVTRLITDGI